MKKREKEMFNRIISRMTDIEKWNLGPRVDVIELFFGGRNVDVDRKDYTLKMRGEDYDFIEPFLRSKYDVRYETGEVSHSVNGSIGSFFTTLYTSDESNGREYTIIISEEELPNFLFHLRELELFVTVFGNRIKYHSFVTGEQG